MNVELRNNWLTCSYLKTPRMKLSLEMLIAVVNNVFFVRKTSESVTAESQKCIFNP
jgi:hypothetical protein